LFSGLFICTEQKGRTMNASSAIEPTLITVQPAGTFTDPFFWNGDPSEIVFDFDGIHTCLNDQYRPLYVVSKDGRCGLTNAGRVSSEKSGIPTLAFSLPVLPENLGEDSFRETHRVKFALYGGAMANGISSEEMVLALSRAGFMGTFGSGGLAPERVEQAIDNIQQALPDLPCAFNLLNSPYEPALEQRIMELYLRRNIRLIEASAYLGPTDNLVWYRASGLSETPQGGVHIGHRIIAKLSRKEVARKFLAPAPGEALSRLQAEGRISDVQARLASLVPMADDITVEADSGGHTDNRPLIALLPAMLSLRDELQEKYRFAQPVRIGAAGGIATPNAALAAFLLGAAYIVTGSVNQSCLEAGTSDHVKKLLSQAEMTDVAMAPASDMFEMGARVQVLKRGSMFAMRAQRLYELYSHYGSLEEIPAGEREKMESSILQQSMEKTWQDCLRFFEARDAGQVQRAAQDPKHRMALVFRWYLGLSSRWATQSEKGREMDYQIWCGPAMGAFNDWARGSCLEDPTNRRVADVALQILTGAAYLYRLEILAAQGIRFSPRLRHFRPVPPA
jgi:trans-AT polyketide synthase/acyltransferase/oxidoreductase domain-containing protein